MYEQTAYDGAGAGRDRIAQALMQVQSPPPTADVPAMPPPPMPGGAPGGGPGAPGGGAITPAAAGMPAASMPGMGQQLPPQLGSAVPPGMQPGGMLAPQGAAPQPMPPRY